MRWLATIKKEEHKLLNHFNKAVENPDDKSNNKMTDWEVRVQAQLDVMEKR